MSTCVVGYFTYLITRKDTQNIKKLVRGIIDFSSWCGYVATTSDLLLEDTRHGSFICLLLKKKLNKIMFKIKHFHVFYHMFYCISVSRAAKIGIRIVYNFLLRKKVL